MDIPISDSFLKLLSHKEVRKLDRIRQLGPVALVYPGAVHTRLDHSLGVFHISWLILQQLLKTKPNFATIEEANSFLAAALLHDLGHFPYAHSLKELPLADHEKLGANIIDEDKQLKELIENLPANYIKVEEIIDKSRKTADENTILFRSILSGALDPDKLDYLSRDAYFCGVPYGMQDVSYILKKISLFKKNTVLSYSAISSVEHLLFSKYLMYRNVYWHKTTRNATAMIRKAIYLALKDKILQPEDLYCLDDAEFFNLPNKINFRPFELLNRVQDNQLFYTCYEAPFDSTNKFHQNCLNLDNRLEYEEKLFKILNKKNANLEKHQIIIDIPEPISFETHLLLNNKDQILDFAEVDELFTPPVINAFSKTLRKVRIFSAISDINIDLENL